MVKIRKYANGIERFLHGEKGQRFFNFAYSIGAAIVIWGALFKILHLPGGSTLLCIGMGTEIAMFILTAFDRPPKEYNWEDVFPVLDSHRAEDRPDFNGGGGVTGGVVIQGADGTVLPAGDMGATGLTIAAGGDPTQTVPADLGEASQRYADGLTAIADQLRELQETTRSLNEASATLLESYRAINAQPATTGVSGYADQMADLARNIAGLNTIYEIQLKSVSGQLETIDRVNRSMKDIRDMYEKSANESSRYCEETEKMARYMKQLNSVYEKMITAMTINMQAPMMAQAQAIPNPFTQEEEKPAASGAAE